MDGFRRSTSASLLAILVALSLHTASGAGRAGGHGVWKRASMDVGFTEGVDNQTVVVGRNATLRCSVQNLGDYKIAWVKADSQTLLSIAKTMITRNYRARVSNSDNSTWFLHINNVRLADRGYYMCQINTVPMVFRQGYLEVVDLHLNLPSLSKMLPRAKKVTVCYPFGYMNPFPAEKRCSVWALDGVHFIEKLSLDSKLIGRVKNLSSRLMLCLEYNSSGNFEGINIPCLWRLCPIPSRQTNTSVAAQALRHQTSLIMAGQGRRSPQKIGVCVTVVNTLTDVITISLVPIMPSSTMGANIVLAFVGRKEPKPGFHLRKPNDANPQLQIAKPFPHAIVKSEELTQNFGSSSSETESVEEVKRTTGILSFKAVKRTDMGHYLCIASNTVPPSVSKRVVLNVRYREPEVEVNLQMIGVYRGDDVAINCTVTAYPRPVVLWQDSFGKMIISGGRYEVVEKLLRESPPVIQTSLIIKSLQPEDITSYRCNASIDNDKMKEKSVTVQLNEIMRPSTESSFNQDIHYKGTYLHPSIGHVNSDDPSNTSGIGQSRCCSSRLIFVLVGWGMVCQVLRGRA
ncbi:uncharacterized protein LOC125041402 [Penaeus chinensis]|uniref:uncharacterized protein LOC125041402 n=1 Tax=Penaeus chinensis TaxID=139456 RepID=UPI001FB65870|nr:uncharacterized protein LOC125041402 [Penaeus chinensis]